MQHLKLLWQTLHVRVVAVSSADLFGVPVRDGEFGGRAGQQVHPDIVSQVPPPDTQLPATQAAALLKHQAVDVEP